MQKSLYKTLSGGWAAFDPAAAAGQKTDLEK